MTFGKWLNSLTALDHGIIFGLFLIACGLAYVTFQGLRNVYNRFNKENPFAHELRFNPFFFLGFAILYTIILYRLFGEWITVWIQTLF